MEIALRDIIEALVISMKKNGDPNGSGTDGERQNLGFTLAELKDGEERVGVCAFFKDLTHVEMAEESENLKQRLLMLGQMAAGLAHEIRNPIASIGVHCSILRSNLTGNGKLLSSIEMMTREIEKIEYIIRECLNFVRPAELGIRPMRVDSILEGVAFRSRTIHPGMEYTIHKSKGTEFTAEVDGSLLEQAVTNLLSNAVDACEGKGKIEISFGISRHYSELLRLDRRAEALLPGDSGKEGEFIRITVRDNGPVRWTSLPQKKARRSLTRPGNTSRRRTRCSLWL